MENNIISGVTPTKCLNWVYRKNEEKPIYPPAVADVDGELFQLNYFEVYSKEYFSAKAESIEEAINMSVNLYGISTLNTVELAYLTAVCDKVQADKTKIEAFDFHNIKGKKNFDTLKAITYFCPVLQRYLSIKTIPLKTIAVFDKLEKEFRRFVKNTVDDKELSVQDFRKMVNLLFDMQSAATEEDMGPDLLNKLAEKKDITRIGFMKEMQNLTKGINVNIFSDNNYETGELTFSFKAESVKDLDKMLKSIETDKEKIEKIYRFLDEQDIC